MAKHAEREKIIKAVIRRLAAERADPSSSFDYEMEYCDDLIDEAAKALAFQFGWHPPGEGCHPGECCAVVLGMADPEIPYVPHSQLPYP